MTAPIEGMKTIPEYHDNQILMGAFIGLIRFAFMEDEIVKKYKDDTGKDIRRIFPTSPIEMMVDKACGYDKREDFCAFADWVNVTMWGEEGSHD